MARYIDEAELVKAIIRERDKIPLKTPCATYELLDEKPNQIGEAMRGGIRKALRCISEAPTADVVKVVRCKDCEHWERLFNRPFVEPRDDGMCRALYQFHDAERCITYEDHFCSYGTPKERGGEK